ncbi:MAG TPA: hypothetical protein PKI14_07970 [Fervidobacterium sp.]|nr:hypothetical protein [Fervidobacterium sp.]
MTIQKLAEEWLEWFVWDKDREIYYLKENAPYELLEVVRMAHGDMLPDNYKYEFIVEALEAIADYDGDEDDIEELADDLEADCYDSDLLEWLNSHSIRTWYVDKAVEEMGHGGGIMEDIAMGQVEEKREVFFTVLEDLRENLEEDDEEWG